MDEDEREAGSKCPGLLSLVLTPGASVNRLENPRELASFMTLSVLCLVLSFPPAFLTLASRAGSVLLILASHSVLYATELQQVLRQHLRSCFR